MFSASNQKLRVLAVIPARSGSKGVPGKNRKLLNGKPLVQYTIESAQQAALVTKTLVTTDDPAILEIARNMGVDFALERPAVLSLDTTPTLPVIKQALQWLEQQGFTFDAVCLLQPTCPFRPEGFVDNCIERFSGSGADSLISVLPVPAEFNPHWVFEPEADDTLRISTGELNIIPRRQELPKAYYRDGTVYLTRTSTILGKNSLYGEKIAYVEANPIRHVNIDTLQDWIRAEEIAAELSCAE